MTIDINSNNNSSSNISSNNENNRINFSIDSNCSVPHVDSEYCLFKTAIDVYVIIALCIFGLLCNTLSIVVLGRDRMMRDTTRFLLQMLSISDSFYLAACFFFQTFATLEECTLWHETLNFYWAHLKTPAYVCASIAQTSTVWMVVIVTADRWVAIIHPLHISRYSTLAIVRREVAVAWILATLYNVPRVFERSVETLVNYQEAETVTRCWRVTWTKLREDPYYVVIYDCALFFLLRFFLPLSLIAFFNTRLIQTIHASYRYSEQLYGGRELMRINRSGGFITATNERELTSGFTTGADVSCCGGREVNYVLQRKRHTQMLIVVVFVLFFCELPDFILRVFLSVHSVRKTIDASYAEDYFNYQRPILRYANVVSNLLLTVNSCCNFVIYIFVNKKFRALFFAMLRGKKYRPNKAAF